MFDNYLPLVKRCGMCRDFKRRDFFSKRTRSIDGLQSYCKACKKDYSQANITRLTAARNRWAKANPAMEKARHNRRRARLRKATGSFTAWDWLRIIRKYQNRCVACLSLDKKLTADHVVPLAVGGSNDASNIQPLCGSCNSSKHIKVIDYRPDFLDRVEKVLHKTDDSD